MRGTTSFDIFCVKIGARVSAVAFLKNPKKVVNKQIGVGDSKYVIVFEPLLTGHVIRRMRSGRVRILNGNERETL